MLKQLPLTNKIQRINSLKEGTMMKIRGMILLEITIRKSLHQKSRITIKALAPILLPRLVEDLIPIMKMILRNCCANLTSSVSMMSIPLSLIPFSSSSRVNSPRTLTPVTL
jgi:hypothetical protein